MLTTWLRHSDGRPMGWVESRSVEALHRVEAMLTGSGYVLDGDTGCYVEPKKEEEGMSTEDPMMWPYWRDKCGGSAARTVREYYPGLLADNEALRSAVLATEGGEALVGFLMEEVAARGDEPLTFGSLSSEEAYSRDAGPPVVGDDEVHSHGEPHHVEKPPVRGPDIVEDLHDDNPPPAAGSGFVDVGPNGEE